MNYTVMSSADVGKGKRCGRLEKVLNSCLIVWESEFSREVECDH